MKHAFMKWNVLLLAGTLLFASCDKEDGLEDNEEEVITTLQLTFAPANGTNPLVYKFEDLDGDGGANPVVENIVLAPNTTYNVTVQLLNKTENPAEDITVEVAEEGDAHRFYYQPSAGSNITVSDLNNDADGAPLGITSRWATGNAANGTVMVTLRHYGGNPPNKSANDPVNSPKSSTDIEVTFNTRVQ